MNWLQKPSTPGGIVYLSAVGMLAVGLAIVVAGGWRIGVALMGCSFGIAFVGRIALPEDRAGMLRIRRPLLDLTTMGVCCVAMFVLALVIPEGT